MALSVILLMAFLNSFNTPLIALPSQFYCKPLLPHNGNDKNYNLTDNKLKSETKLNKKV